MTIEYNLTVETEYHIGTGLEHPGVVDRTLITRSDGTLVIPAEHFRGIVRDACTQILYWLSRAEVDDGKEERCCKASLTKAPLQSQRGVPKTCGLNFRSEADPCVMCRLFGTTFIPKRYHFFDAETDQKCKSISMHNRVDPATGRVPKEMFFSFEMGSPVTFTGRIERDKSAVKQEQLDEEIGLLLAGLRLVERVGARSRRGLGKCRVKITNPKDVDKRLRAYLENDQNGGKK